MASTPENQVPPAPSPPPPRRVVATQTGPDTAIFSSDGNIPLISVPGTPYYRASVWVEKTFPADNSDVKKDTGLAALSTVVQPNGLSFFYLDLPPASSGLMHYTDSIDFGVVILGKVELELPGGDKTLLSAGDSFVQRGNAHAWNVPSDDEWARLLVVVTHGKQLDYKVDDKTVSVRSAFLA